MIVDGSGRYAYLLGDFSYLAGDNRIDGFAIDLSSGVLTANGAAVLTPSAAKGVWSSIRRRGSCSPLLTDSREPTIRAKRGAMDYDLGFFDHETCRLESAGNPFAAKVLPMCWV